MRPTLIPDRATYRRRFETWLKDVDILRLSLADLEWLYPGSNPEPLVNDWLTKGPSMCLLTLGANGAKGYTKSGLSVETVSPQIQVVDTVGAGDTFLAASLAFLHAKGLLTNHKTLESIEHSQLAACLNFAARAAAINCSRPGANPPYLYEMDNAFDLIRPHQIKVNIWGFRHYNLVVFIPIRFYILVVDMWF